MPHTVFYSPEYARRKEEFDTTRKCEWVFDSLQSRPVSGVTIAHPEPASERAILETHTERYVDSILYGDDPLCESSGLQWCQHTYTAASASTGGVIEAAIAAARNGGVAGSLSSGLHHARTDCGSGFCTFNGLAIAAREAYGSGHAKKVLILDLDAHCGGGTASLISGEGWIYQLDIAVNGFDSYKPQKNAKLVKVDDGHDYLHVLNEELQSLDQFDLCLFNAGVDVHQNDCGVSGIDSTVIVERDLMVFEWAARRRMPVAYVLAGGYVGKNHDRATVAALHRATIRSAEAFHWSKDAAAKKEEAVTA